MRLTSADAAIITRTSKTERQVKYIARCCIQEGKVWPSQPQTQTEFVLGNCIYTAKAGSIWKLSDVKATDNASTYSYRDQHPNGLGEVIVVPLETKGGHVDHLELHYRHRPKSYDLDLLTVLASTLASGWRRRVPGSISAASEQVRRHRLRVVQVDGHVPILDPQNPTELSRCEFRVCAMMKEGMTVKKISETLSVCPTTVRSHLSSIFSKTGASNQVELLHLLNRKTEARHKSTRSGISHSG
ncbi:helix-turn-helix transcriptional regulator [Ruegeria lacuscaerulensis]|uniref:helix-turn-helix transcriptional regulator n=1 Tax=Ruegeria lacuscaerulensis TaxID=55218 RepID=UPI003AF87691